MSSVGIKDATNATREIDTFVRTEGATQVETQAVAIVDPTTGAPLVPTPEGKLPIVASALPLPDGAATEATLQALNTLVDAIGSLISSLNTKTTTVNTGAIAGTVALDAPTLAALESITASTGGLTDAQLRAAALAVSGTFWQATQPVSFTWAGLTDTQLRATAVPVSGTFWQATQPVSFTWAGLTDAQLRASAVPVSVSNFPGSQAVTGTFWQATQPISASDLPLPTGAATQATLAAVEAKLPALDAGRLPVVLPPGGSGLTDAELRATAVPVDVAAELVEAIGTMRMAVNSLTRTIGLLIPDTAGRMRAVIETGSTVSVSALPTLANVTTLATLTNQAQVGAFAANDQIPSLMKVAAMALRNNIQVS